MRSETRYFTVEEANALLPTLQPLLAEVMLKRAEIAEAQRKNAGMLQNTLNDIGSPTLTRLTLVFQEIETLVAQIAAFGCEIKSLHIGLLDFPARINGRDVYLCWRYGEPRITHYHGIHDGFAGRRPLPGPQD